MGIIAKLQFTFSVLTIDMLYMYFKALSDILLWFVGRGAASD